jgi:hypothetical protein
MDDGSVQSIKKHAAKLSTQGFTLEENQIIQRWFVETYSIEAKIQLYKGLANIRFNWKPATRLWQIIAPYTIPSMQYKIGEYYHE